MLNLECSRCGAKIRRLNKKTSISSKSFPIFKITKYSDYDGEPTQVELCKKCSNKFDEWLQDSLDEEDDTIYD